MDHLLIILVIARGLHRCCALHEKVMWRVESKSSSGSRWQ